MRHQPLASVLQQRFQLHLDQAGVWMVYTRSDPRFPCRECTQLAPLSTRDHRVTCGTCFGTGKQVTLERWLVYYSNVLRPTSIPTTSLTPIGWTTEHQPVIFTRHRDIPSIGDRFFLVEWDRGRDQVPYPGSRPIRIAESNEVTWVEPMIAGEVIYYAVHCNITTENLRDYETALFQTTVQETRN